MNLMVTKRGWRERTEMGHVHVPENVHAINVTIMYCQHALVKTLNCMIAISVVCLPLCMVCYMDIFILFSFFKVISQQVSDEHLEEGRLYPPLTNIRDVSLKIAVKVLKSYCFSFLLLL